MTRPFLIPFLALASLMTAPLAAPAADEPPPAPDAILNAVRRNYIAQELEAEGRLRASKSRPFKMAAEPGSIRFYFTATGEIIELLQDESGKITVRERRGDSMVPIASNRYGENVQGMDFTYEDLGMRYLAWPGGVHVGKERVSGDECWMIRVKNPSADGPYRYVVVSIGQKSGAVLQMRGEDAQGRLVRRFVVTGVHKLGDVWMVKQMRIESFDPTTGKRVGERTYFETNDPHRRSGGFKKR